MSRKLTMLRSELNRLRKATGVDAKGTSDNFPDIAVAVPEPDDRSQQEVYECYSEEEIEFCFGRDRWRWPEWLKVKFGV